MEEYTNSPMFDENDDGSNLFVDATEETTEDVQDQDEHVSTEDEPADGAADKPAEDTADKPADKPGIRITYLGEEKDLSYEDAVTLAQKGMNYDRILQERDTLKAARDQTDSSLREVEKWAHQAGMELNEYIDYLQTTRRAQDVEREVNSIRQKYPDIPEEAAKEMAETRIKEKDAKEQQTAQQRKTEAEKAEQKPWEDFVQRYPSMDTWEKIPADVVSEIESGASPVEAMQRHEMRELQKQIADLNTKIGQLEQNKKNKEAALPSASSTRDTEPKDAFLEGLGF